MKVATARQMAELDRITVEQYGIPTLVLMENAGRSCAERILRILQEKVGAPEEASVAIACGRGNNGGDGMVIARHLQNRGVYVEVFLLSEIEDLSRDARTQFEILRKMDVETRIIRDQEGVADLRTYLEEVHLCVDAILGTGLSSPLQGIVREVVETINLSMATVYAVDIPSGIDATSGRILGEAIRADYTGTFGLLKLGQVLLPGSIHCGETDVYDIGIPSKAVFDIDIQTEALEERVVKSMLSIRPPDFHKGDAGRVYIVGGSPGMTGAPCLAGRAAMRMGAGLITVVVPGPFARSSRRNYGGDVRGVEDGGSGLPERGDPGPPREDLARRFCRVGSRAGDVPGSGGVHRGIVPRIKVPFLIDADG